VLRWVNQSGRPQIGTVTIRETARDSPVSLLSHRVGRGLGSEVRCNNDAQILQANVKRDKRKLLKHLKKQFKHEKQHTKKQHMSKALRSSTVKTLFYSYVFSSGYYVGFSSVFSKLKNCLIS